MKRSTAEITVKRFDQLKVGDRYQHVLWAKTEGGQPRLSRVRTAFQVRPLWGMTEIQDSPEGRISLIETYPNWHKVILLPRVSAIEVRTDGETKQLQEG